MKVYLQKGSLICPWCSQIIYKIFTKCPHAHSVSLFLLALLFHPRFHGLNAVITLGDCLPARTRMDLRELARQEIVQCLKQNHLQRPAGSRPNSR